VWNTRNKYLFEEGFRIDVNVWTNALKFVNDFRKMAESTVDSGAIVRGGWSCPQPGCWKINFDGAKLGEWGHGWGMVIRDIEGDVALAAVQQGPEFLGPEIEEARACRCTLQVALHHGFQSIVLEGDCPTLILKLKKH